MPFIYIGANYPLKMTGTSKVLTAYLMRAMTTTSRLHGTISQNAVIFTQYLVQMFQYQLQALCSIVTLVIVGDVKVDGRIILK
jgi:hypothetical protein